MSMVDIVVQFLPNIIWRWQHPQVMSLKIEFILYTIPLGLVNKHNRDNHIRDFVRDTLHRMELNH